MQTSTGDKHIYINFESTVLTRDLVGQLAEKTAGCNQDVIINLSAITEASDDLVSLFIDVLSAVLDTHLVLLIGNEDKLESLGFLAEEFPVTPTYNEGMDFLFMLQLERELGADE